MKKNIIILLSAIFFIMLLLVISSIMTIGDKIAVIGSWASYLFYIIVTTILIIFVVIPTIKMFKSPTMPDFDPENPDLNIARKTINTILKNNQLNEDERARIEFEIDSLGEYAVVRELWDKYAKKMDDIIRKNAATIFTLSAISQRGRIDLIISIVINFTMINNLVKATGFRPTYAQLIKIYWHVLGASFVAMTSDDILDEINLDFGQFIGGVGVFAFKSITNGALNAYLTLRIGYMTKEYVRLGGNFNPKEARTKARKSAHSAIKPMIMEMKDTIISMLGKVGA